VSKAALTQAVELELYVARLEQCVRRQIRHWRAHGGPEARAALVDIFEALGDVDQDGAVQLGANVLARTVDDILTLTGNGDPTRGDSAVRRPFYARWDADSEAAFRAVCEQDDDVVFWCDLVGIEPDVLSVECAERMAQCPIGWLL
jgi:hypothetical protein